MNPQPYPLLTAPGPAILGFRVSRFSALGVLGLYGLGLWGFCVNKLSGLGL